MCSRPPWVIDSHVHLDQLSDREPESPAWFVRHGCTTISWAFAPAITSVGELGAYLQRKARLMETFHSLSRRGCFFMTGIHPRSIPKDLVVEKIPQLLLGFLDHPLCLGMGEIGLESGSGREVDIFTAQLELASALKNPFLRIGVHTPRKNKTPITLQTLSILDRYPDLSARLVVDHCDPEILPFVLERGLVAGVTLSPAKTSLAALIGMLAAHPQAERSIMCNTDSCDALYEDLLVAAGCAEFTDQVRAGLFCRNAARFFGLKIDDAGVVVRSDGP